MAPPLAPARAWQVHRRLPGRPHKLVKLDPIDDGACSAYPLTDRAQEDLCTSRSASQLSTVLQSRAAPCWPARSLILALTLGAPSQALAACGGTTVPTGAHAPSTGERGHAHRRHHASRVKLLGNFLLGDGERQPDPARGRARAGRGAETRLPGGRSHVDPQHGQYPAFAGSQDNDRKSD